MGSVMTLPVDLAVVVEQGIAVLQRNPAYRDARTMGNLIRAADAVGCGDSIPPKWRRLVSLAAETSRLIDLSSHKPGTPYHWKHGYIPLDAETAASNRKGKAMTAKLRKGDAPTPSTAHTRQVTSKAKPKVAKPKVTPKAVKPSEPLASPAAVAEAHKLIEQATTAEPKLTATVHDLARQLGGEPVMLDKRLKTEDSLARKIEGDVAVKKLPPDQVAKRLFDTNRYTIASDRNYAQAAQTAIDTLRAQGNTVNVKNFWNDPKNPYQGINLQITSPEGLRWELQLHTKDSLAAKKPLHDIYVKSRVETDQAKIEAYRLASLAVTAKIPVPAGVAAVH